MHQSASRVSRRKFLQLSAALPVCLMIPVSKGSANANEDLDFARSGYGIGPYGSGPYGIDSHNLYLPAIQKGGA